MRPYIRTRLYILSTTVDQKKVLRNIGTLALEINKKFQGLAKSCAFLNPPAGCTSNHPSCTPALWGEGLSSWVALSDGKRNIGTQHSLTNTEHAREYSTRSRIQNTLATASRSSRIQHTLANTERARDSEQKLATASRSSR